MAKMKDYDVVSATDVGTLRKRVNSFLPEFELVGGIAMDRNVNTGVVQYCQAIAKPVRARKKS